MASRRLECIGSRVYIVRSTCRACDSTDMEIVLSIEDAPLPEALLSASELAFPEETFPLDLVFCRECSLLQTMQTVSPSKIYDERYLYYSAYSAANVGGFQNRAKNIASSRGLGSDSFVIEIGSNDGVLLKSFKVEGVQVLGIDPAPGPAQEARRTAIPTLTTFFTREVGMRLFEDGRCADVVLTNDVLSSTPSLHGFLGGVLALLEVQGVAVIEVPYVRDLVERCEFETIHHQHLSYFSVTSLDRLLRRERLHLNHVEYVGAGGGHLRVEVGKWGTADESVERFLREEEAAGLTSLCYYKNLTPRLDEAKAELIATLSALKRQGRSIVGYGATARSTATLNFLGLDDGLLDYVVDRNAHKQGWFLPGVHLPVLPAERLASNRPDYVVVLDRDLRDEVALEQDSYREGGGHVIVPLTEPSIP